MMDPEEHPGGDPILDLLREHQLPPERDADAFWERIRQARRMAAEDEEEGSRGASRVRRWVAAALVALVAAGALSVRPVRTSLAQEVVAPVRTWAAERLAVLDALLAPRPAPTTPPASPGPSLVSLYPSESLRVQIDRCQQAGRLEILLHDSDLAVLEIIEGDGPVSLAVGSSVFVLANEAGATASYRLLVPRRVRHLRIRMSAQIIRIPLNASEPTGWVLYLRTPDEGEIGHCYE